MTFEKDSILPQNLDASRERSEEEQKAEIAKNLEFSLEKKKLLERIEKDKKLAYLKSIIERGLIKMATIERIVAGEGLDNEDVREIFEKIDEIEATVGIDAILPQNLRITKAEYLQAIDDQNVRKTVLTKLDASLDHLYSVSHPYSNGLQGLFAEFFSALNKQSKTINQVQ